MPSEDENIRFHEVIDPQADAYRERDLDEFISYYADDIKVYRNADLWISGILDLKEKYGELFRLSPNLTLEIVERRIEGIYVYDTEHITGLRGDPRNISAIVRYKIEHNKISEVQVTRPIQE